MTIFTDDAPVAALKRALALPGQFTATWPNVSDQEVADLLADGFARARLAGWFPTATYDVDIQEVTPDLTDAGLMLVIQYAARQVLVQRLLTLQSAASYKAGPVEYSTTPQSNVLVALLRSAENEIELVRQQVVSRVVPEFGDLTAIRLGLSAGQLASYEWPLGVPALY